MGPVDLAVFRRRCGQFRWLAYLMVASVGALLLALHAVMPVIAWANGQAAPVTLSGRHLVAGWLWAAPAICYLFGVWSIGVAMGRLAQGRLIHPTLGSALRRVGLALGLGGVLSVFVVVNLVRVLGEGGGYLHFDIPGMTLGLIGGALFLLGRVVDQAGQLQAELDEIV